MLAARVGEGADIGTVCGGGWHGGWRWWVGVGGQSGGDGGQECSTVLLGETLETCDEGVGVGAAGGGVVGVVGGHGSGKGGGRSSVVWGSVKSGADMVVWCWICMCRWLF